MISEDKSDCSNTIRNLSVLKTELTKEITKCKERLNELQNQLKTFETNKYKKFNMKKEYEIIHITKRYKT